MWWLKTSREIIRPRTEITKVNRGVPLTLTNPWYKDILAEYNHLREVEMDDVDLKRELPVHLILGTSEYSSIVLHWIKWGGNYKQFVGNRVRKIKDKN